MSTGDHHMLSHVLERFFPMGQQIVITKQSVPQIATSLIEIFTQLGWRLEYDPSQLEKTIAAEIERLGPAPDGIPAREPELFESPS